MTSLSLSWNECYAFYICFAFLLVTFLVDVAVVATPDKLLLSGREFRCFGGESGIFFEGFDRKEYVFGEGCASFLALALVSTLNLPP